MKGSIDGIVLRATDVSCGSHIMTMERLLIVTGLSGAGRSTSLKFLEDLGFEAVDNLPIPLIEKLVDIGEPLERDLAIGIDSRTRAFDVQHLIQLAERHRLSSMFKSGLLFCDCDDEILLRRYTENRRPHPMGHDHALITGIQNERELLIPIKKAADWVVDTSDYSPSRLHQHLKGLFGKHDKGKMSITVMSFAFRNGLPREADLVFDVRFLRNPHYVPEMKKLTGESVEVGEYIAQDPHFTAFYEKILDLIKSLLPRYAAEGKSYLTIAFGCTGGQHRSVYLASKLTQSLEELNNDVHKYHREQN